MLEDALNEVKRTESDAMLDDAIDDALASGGTARDAPAKSSAASAAATTSAEDTARAPPPGGHEQPRGVEVGSE